MVVPDGVVQAERLVAVAPLVAGPRVPVDDDVVDAELAQPRTERDAALAAADDDDVRLAVACRGPRPRRRAAPSR